MDQSSLKEYRCACGKLLFKGEPLFSMIEVKCKRCGTVKVFVGESHLGDDNVVQTRLFAPNQTDAVVTPYASRLEQCLILRDAPADKQEKLLFHIHAGDYFTMLDTILGFVLEDELIADSKSEHDKLMREYIKATREDLAYLHEHYRIVPM